MCIIHNGNTISISEDILLRKWRDATVFGDEKPDKPSLCVFNNTAKALKLLNKHVERNSKIVLGTDVDVDGVGTTFIIKKVMEYLGSNNHLLLINKDKVHGIQQKHVEYFNTKCKVDLIIVTDSSCNEIELIKKFNCDVLVIDHHDLLQNDLSGVCEDGVHEYVIVNSTIDNNNLDYDKEWLDTFKKEAFNNLSEYKGTNDMSCGLVVYELMRIYCICFYEEKLLENLELFQWVGVTLFTDVIDTLNKRNQWYLNKTVFNSDTEKSLGVILKSLNSFRLTLDKSYIQYTFAPIVNKAIRAGKSSEVVDIIINNPYKITELDKYKAMQQEAIDKAIYVKYTDEFGIEHKNKKVFKDESICLDVSSLGISVNYCGVIASKLCGENKKNCVVYSITDKGLCKGSFRGKHKTVNYRKYFECYADNIYAQGHPGAFGFEMTKEQLNYLMSNISSVEPVVEDKPFFTAGNMRIDEYGEYHIADMDEFKRKGFVWKVATGNAKVSSQDEIMIRVKASDVKFKSSSGKVLNYDVLGFTCKAFKPLEGEYFDIYLELNKDINAYIREV